MYMAELQRLTNYAKVSTKKTVDIVVSIDTFLLHEGE